MIRNSQGSVAAGPAPRQIEDPVREEDAPAPDRSQPTPAQLYYLRRQKLRRAQQSGQR